MPHTKDRTVREPWRSLPVAARPVRGRRLPPAVAFYVFASIAVSFLAASSAPTPLYALYQEHWGFTPITTTVVFAVYAVAVLAGLLTLGKVSDHVGRRPVLLAALVGQIASMTIFTTATGVSALVAARVVQGLATGGALGTIGAAMLDLDRPRGTVANTIVPGTGTAVGALASALVVQYLPAPTHLIYLALLVLFVLQGVGVALARETASRAPGALSTLVPEIRLPRQVRHAALAASPVLFAVWALAGFYGSLAPALTRALTGSSSVVLGGSGLFVFAGAGVVAVVLLRGTAPGTVMTIGVVSLVAGVAVTLGSLSLGSPLLFLLGSMVAGAGFGSGFQGGVRTVMPLTEPRDSSAVLSFLYVVSYLGMGVPTVIAGFLVVHAGGLFTTAREYAVAVLALALFSLLARGFHRR
ncbi:MFS transporter [Streptomyces flaveolus]|uniref:MFS transporter n=1 Tax=Streptomyces flaveolus TaxID=67297 RepID=UPI0033A36EB6